MTNQTRNQRLEATLKLCFVETKKVKKKKTGLKARKQGLNTFKILEEA